MLTALFSSRSSTSATIPTAIRPLPERHGLLVPTAATGLARIALIYLDQFFPSQDAFVAEHLHKAIEAPIVVDRPMEGFQMLGRVPW